MDTENLPTTIEGCYAHIREWREIVRVQSKEIARLIRDLDIAANMIAKAREALTPTTERNEGV